MNRNDQFGPIFALAARFATEIAGMNLPLEVIQGAKEASKEDPLWKKVREAFLPEEMPMSPGLELGAGKAGRTTILPVTAASEVFNPAQKFVVDTSYSASVKIGGLDDNFRRWMPQMLSSVTDKGELRSWILPNQMLDKDIIRRVGGVGNVIVSLEEVWGEIMRSTSGKKALISRLVRDHGNIFYVPQAVTWLGGRCFGYRDFLSNSVTEERITEQQHLFRNNNQWFVLRAVCVYWGDDGWSVGALSVEDPYRWNAGDQVFSRNSVLRRF